MSFVPLFLAAQCVAGVAANHLGDFYFENDKFGIRAYGRGDPHVWSGFDIFNKGVSDNEVTKLLVTELGKRGNWHQVQDGRCFDNYTMGASRGVGGVAMFADGEWKTYPHWTDAKVIHQGDDYLECELVFPEFAWPREMTCRIVLRAGDHFFRNTVTFAKEVPQGFLTGPGLDIEPKRDHRGDLLEDQTLGLVSLFEDPKGKDGEEGSTMSAVFVDPADAGRVKFMTDHMNSRVLAFDGPRRGFTYWAGCANSLRGEFRTAAEWHRHVKEFQKNLGNNK